MLPTVREVLVMPTLLAGDAEVLACSEHLDRSVRWLHPAEVADIAPLLRGDELVLTAGTVLPDDDNGLRTYVKSLSEAGVAGLVVELGRKWDVVPSALPVACSEEGLVLVVLHREVRFADVVKEIGARILDAEVEDLRVVEQIHETFTRLDIKGVDSQEILAAVVRFVRAPVVLESSRHQALAYDGAGQGASELLADWSKRSRSVGLSGRTSYDRTSGWLTTLVGSRGDDWGRLVLMAVRPPRRRDYVLVERAAAALTLHQLHSAARDSVERTAHNSLLAEIASGEIAPATATRCQALEFPVSNRRFLALAARSRVASNQDKLWSIATLASIVSGAARSLDVPMIVGTDTDRVLALMSLEPVADPHYLLSAVAREIRKSACVSLGRGEIVEGLNTCYLTLTDAENALEASDPDDERPWVSLDDVHVRGFMHLLRDDPRLAAYVRRELGPLIEHDRGCDGGLLDLLSTYLDTPGGKAAAAKKLLLSRPVLYQRLNRIERILGAKLDDPQTRTSLHLAVLARAAIDVKPA